MGRSVVGLGIYLELMVFAGGPGMERVREGQLL